MEIASKLQNIRWHRALFQGVGPIYPFMHQISLVCRRKERVQSSCHFERGFRLFLLLHFFFTWRLRTVNDRNILCHASFPCEIASKGSRNMHIWCVYRTIQCQ